MALVEKFNKTQSVMAKYVMLQLENSKGEVIRAKKLLQLATKSNFKAC